MRPTIMGQVNVAGDSGQLATFNGGGRSPRRCAARSILPSRRGFLGLTAFVTAS
jgi:hypothetical protein